MIINKFFDVCFNEVAISAVRMCASSLFNVWKQESNANSNDVLERCLVGHEVSCKR